VYPKYGLEEWDSTPAKPEVMDPIPQVSFRPYDPAIDDARYKLPTPSPVDELPSTLQFIAEETEDEEEDDETPDFPMDPLTLANPPPTPPVDLQLTLSPPHPVDPPSPPKQMGIQVFQKIKLKFPFLFK
jgi:hypothetical protein